MQELSIMDKKQDIYRPTLADQHWRAGLPRKKQSDLATEIQRAIEDGHEWRFSVLLPFISERAQDAYYLGFCAEHGREDMFHAIAARLPKWEEAADINDLTLRSARGGHLGILRYLIEEKSGDPQAYQGDPLLVAVEGGHIETVRYLISKGVDPGAWGGRVIQAAAVGGRLEIFKAVACDEVNLKMYGEEALFLASQSGAASIALYLLEQSIVGMADRPRAFMAAARAGHVEVLRAFANHGLTGDHNDSAAFLEAVYADKFDAADELLRTGADINNKDGWALRRAVNYNEAEPVAYLLKRGADPNAREGRETPLVRASASGNTKIIALLLEGGADHSLFQFDALRTALDKRERRAARMLVQWDRKFLATRKQEKLAEFEALFQGGYTVADLRARKGASGESGLLIAAQTGKFDVLLKKASGFLQPEDLFHPDEGLQTVFSQLKRHKAIRQFFEPEFWKDRSGDLSAAHSLLPPHMQKRTHLQGIASRINRAELQKKARDKIQRPPKL